jgi:hypothetical protein
VMLVTKCVKFLARLGSRHRPSSSTPPNELPSETVYQWNALVPLDFGVVRQYVLSYASGVQVSRVTRSHKNVCHKNVCHKNVSEELPNSRTVHFINQRRKPTKISTGGTNQCLHFGLTKTVAQSGLF